MKLLICGKGGAGKSTIAALITLEMDRRGIKTFLVDADESNIGLYRMMGIDYPQPLMDHLGGKKGFREKTKSAGLSLGGPPPLFPDNLDVNSLPNACISGKNNFNVMSVGKIHHFGEGCACPMGNLFRLLFSSMNFEEGSLVMVDTAAGIEHFGRRLDAQCDHILCILEPSYESIKMAEKVITLADEAGAGVSLVLNKSTPESETMMRNSLDNKRIIGSIPDDPAISLNNLKGDALDLFPLNLDAICDMIEQLMKDRDATA